ncbi:hypothetical protein U27_06327 [Candidatus Vecturithrix granuli]|uniref:Uncharacterized protein n=1 Tax=Vecturithrix granuli TaxID=1499967 RepID=A0A081C438_VECG1|nr:hypothetical protein U27_06327 [Candidatus Vecturithrix granuli]
MRTRVSNPSRDYSAFLLGTVKKLFALSLTVSNPSRDYSAFLHSWDCRWHRISALVSNPSRDYSAFLLIELSSTLTVFTYSFKPFQGLFRVSTQTGAFASELIDIAFQTLPGIIPRFYDPSSAMNLLKVQIVSNPSRDYSAFLQKREIEMMLKDVQFQTLPGIIPRFYSAVSVQVISIIPSCFKPFQGLFRVSTMKLLIYYAARLAVSNPSRDYSAFLLFGKRGTFEKVPSVSNPSRDYSAFLHFELTVAEKGDIAFQTLPGIIPRFYHSSLKPCKSAYSCFKPFQGLFRVSTVEESTRRRSSRGKFQTLPGIIPRFYINRRRLCAT